MPLWERPLVDAVQEAHDIVERARTEHRPEATFLLTSGGNDSAVLLDTMAEHADAIVHINTGIGIPEANAHARRVGESYGKPFVELHPPIAYEELVLGRWDGFPGPAGHRFAYTMLKERCIRALCHDGARGVRYLLLAGGRLAESRRRMGTSTETHREGRQVWVNPLLRWQNDEMRRYRAEHNLPQSEVAANLHMSGECLCGAMANQGPRREERAAIRFFYPSFDARLSALEGECKRAGKTSCEWGIDRRAPEVRQAETLFAPGPLCVGCDFRGNA